MARDPLDGIELVVFDKDGTLIDFHAMWGGWATELQDRLAAATHKSLGDSVLDLLGVDRASSTVLPHGLLAATPMARIRDRVQELLLERGTDAGAAEAVMASAWHAPDPVSLARPLADLRRLFGALRDSGRRIAIVTSDDRDPTERTLEALGVTELLDAVACADDGHRVKPAPDAVLAVCAALGVDPSRTAVVGDAPSDLRMGRAAGVARVIAVLTGVGDAATLGPLADLVLDSVDELVAAPATADAMANANEPRRRGVSR
jgi:phosphoglycolate phosphatase-like HAD superfamily hydrolase